jgi:PTS system nitrogen regulatory IIA component
MTLVSSLLPASHVLLDVPASDKRAVLEQAAGALEDKIGIKRGQILDSLLARERLGSTGLGQGIAIPHGRLKGLAQAVGAFLRTATPVPFDAPDDAPVRLVFVLLVPETSTGLHLEILSELAEMFSDRELCSRLTGASDATTAHRLISGWQSRVR